MRKRAILLLALLNLFIGLGTELTAACSSPHKGIAFPGWWKDALCTDAAMAALENMQGLERTGFKLRPLVTRNRSTPPGYGVTGIGA